MSGNNTRAWEMKKDIDFCFLNYQSGSGIMSSPMSSIVEQEEDMIYFLSNADAEKIAAISNTPEILLNYTNGSNQFVSTSALASLSTDRELIKRLWNFGAQTFWPEGPEKADVIVICAKPHSAEYWDGPSGVVTFAKMVTAFVSRSQADMGDNAKVKL